MYKVVSAFLLCSTLMAGLLTGPAWAGGAFRYHEVKSSDTVESVARLYGVLPEAIRSANKQAIISNHGLPVGQLIFIPTDEVWRVKVSSSALPKSLASSRSARKRASAGRKAQPKPPKPGYQYYSITPPAPKVVNRAYESDGRVVNIPSYIPPLSPEDLEEIEKSKYGRGGAGQLGSMGRSIVAKAQSFTGVPYVWGGASPEGFDCSGYVQYVYHDFGVELPRTADVQYNVGEVVAPGAEAPGDLVFFETYLPGPSHVGIYVSDGLFIHASSSGCVKTSSLNEEYFKNRYLGARRPTKS